MPPWTGAGTSAQYKRWVGLGFIVGSAVLMARAELQHMVAMSTTTGIAIFALLPFLINVAIIGFAFILWNGSMDGDQVLRIAGWMVVGMVAIGLLAAWTITHQNVRGRSFAHGFFVVVNNLSAGAFLGLVLGWYDTRGRRYKREVEAKRAELRRQVDRLDRFAEVVSHDLRNPLNVAAGNLELVQSDGGSGSLETVATALDRMNDIIADVLLTAREGHAVEETEQVVLSDIVATCWATVPTGEAEVEVVDDLVFDADSARLKLAFENLFRNAIEHGGSDLSVRVGPLDDGFYVEDNGSGIPVDRRESVFELGYSTSESGTGFGLGIVEQLVEAHGWEISVGDGTQGGARFEITGVTTAN